MVRWEHLGIGIVAVVIGFFIAPSITTIMTAFGWSTSSWESLIVSNFLTIIGLILIGYAFFKGDSP